MNICPMCGAPYVPDEENAYYIDEKTVCSRCTHAVEIIMTSDDAKEIRGAFNYISRCYENTSDADVKQHLTDILENNAGLADDIELEKYHESREEYRTLPDEIAQEQNNSIFRDRYSFSTASGENLPYVVIQVTLKEKLWGTGSKNLSELEEVINFYAHKGYRLHTMATSHTDSKGGLGGDRIQATLVFEKKEF